MSDLRLVVNGREFGGWEGISVTRSIESIAGSFDLDVFDRWFGQAVRWPILEEDAARIEIDGVAVIDGFVDRRSVAFSPTSRTMRVSGRDRAAALVDCSAILDRWTQRKKTVLDVARLVAEPFGVSVTAPGLTFEQERKIVINPGDSPFGVIQALAMRAGVLAVSDGVGGLRLVRSGEVRAESLVEGVNVEAGGVDYDAMRRFRRYVVATQKPGSDSGAGPSTRVRAVATDEGVRREDRVLMVRPESGITVDSARARGDWEARVRAARSEVVTAIASGWKQRNGQLWPINALAYVDLPSAGVRGEMLISKATHTVSAQGSEVTQLSLVRPDAFTPEPRAVVRKGGSAAWKELRGGV